MPGNALSQGQIVSVVLFVVGCLGLLAVALWHVRYLRAVAGARVRSVLVGSLMVTAGLALLLVRRLDPAALSRVLAGVGAALLTTHPAHILRKELQ